MVPGSGRERMRPDRAARASRWPPHDRRAFIVRRVGHRSRWRRGHGFLPRALEFIAVALRAITIEEIPVGLNAREDEVLCRFPEDRSPLFRVGIQQRVTAPAVQAGGELPPKIDNIVEAVVE